VCIFRTNHKAILIRGVKAIGDLTESLATREIDLDEEYGFHGMIQLAVSPSPTD
jgi:hypothetical protein